MHQKAFECFENALHFNPDHQVLTSKLHCHISVIHSKNCFLVPANSFQLCGTYSRTGSRQVSTNCLQKAHSIRLIYQLTLIIRSLYRLLRLEKLDKNNEKIYFNLGMLSMDDQHFVEAKKWFDKAINVSRQVCELFEDYVNP
jgi:tetratricopeptide (TPR) repeat protein